MKHIGYYFLPSSITQWFNGRQIVLIVAGLFSLFALYHLTHNYHIITNSIAPVLPISNSVISSVPQSEEEEDEDVSDPFNIYIMSAYYYPTSESMGDNAVGLILMAPTAWAKSINNVTTVRASSASESKTSLCIVEPITSGGWCALHNLFAGCFGVPNMIKFEISLGNDKFHEIPFKTVSYEKKDVVTCVSPLFAAEQWHQVIFAAHIYHHYGTFMHLYIRSVVAPVYELIKAYEKEGYLLADPYPRFKYASIPEYMFNPNKEISFRGQEGSQSDCLLRYKESAQYVTFMDLDDVLIPREAPTYLEEFNIYIHQAEYIYYHKANVYYEAGNDPQSFSIFDIFHSARFLNKLETGKVALIPKYANYTSIHKPDINRYHPESVPMPQQNVIVHLKKAFPLGHANETKQLWPYFYRNDTTIFNEKDTIAIEEDYKRISSKYPDVWKNLNTDLIYYPLILDCFNRKYYQIWYTDLMKLTFCFNPDFCKIPPKLIAPCANGDADYFSSEDGTEINVHYPKNHRFTIEDRCVP